MMESIEIFVDKTARTILNTSHAALASDPTEKSVACAHSGGREESVRVLSPTERQLGPLPILK
jgi:hypothetical protein